MNKKTTDVVTYLSPIGFIIAFLVGSREESRFHLNQSLVLILATIVTSILDAVLGKLPLVGTIVSIVLGFVDFVLFVLWFIGILRAGKGSEEPIPLLGGISLLK